MRKKGLFRPGAADYIAPWAAKGLFRPRAADYIAPWAASQAPLPLPGRFGSTIQVLRSAKSGLSLWCERRMWCILYIRDSPQRPEPFTPMSAGSLVPPTWKQPQAARPLFISLPNPIFNAPAIRNRSKEKPPGNPSGHIRWAAKYRKLLAQSSSLDVFLKP
jgi:hypothetical protein